MHPPADDVPATKPPPFITNAVLPRVRKIILRVSCSFHLTLVAGAGRRRAYTVCTYLLYLCTKSRIYRISTNLGRVDVDV